MARAAFDILLLQRLRAGLTASEPTVFVRPLSATRRKGVHQQLREELELMAWSLMKEPHFFG